MRGRCPNANGLLEHELPNGSQGRHPAHEHRERGGVAGDAAEDGASQLSHDCRLNTGL